MFDVKQFRQHIVAPALRDIDLWSQEAEDLLVGTAAVESKLGTYLVQMGNGPAKGIYQVEVATHQDIWDNYLEYKDSLREALHDLYVPFKPKGSAEDMIYNLRYATAIARIHYLRVPAPLPKRSDYAQEAFYVEALGKYWKKHYNTPLGKGSVEKFVEAYYDCGCSAGG